MANYKFPHVGISTSAILRSTAVPERADNSSLFVPFMSEKGPTNEIVKVRSIEEFQRIFGNLNYEKQGETALVIRNWLASNYGTVYAYRLFDKSGAVKAYAESEIPLYTQDRENHDSYLELRETENAGEYGLYYNGTDQKSYTLIEQTAAEIKMGNKNWTVFIVLDSVIYRTSIDKLPAIKQYDSLGKEIKYYIFKAESDREIKIDDYFDKPAKIKLEVKYYGSYYNGLVANISQRGDGNYRVSYAYKKAGQERPIGVEQLSSKDVTGFTNKSDYIEEIIFTGCEEFFKVGMLPSAKFVFDHAEENTESYFDGDKDGLLAKFFTGDAVELLKNHLDTPFDMIIDCGYSEDAKIALCGLVDEREAYFRDDFNIILSNHVAAQDVNHNFTGKVPAEIGLSNPRFFNDKGLIAAYDQYFLVEDALTDGSVYVTTSYFLSSLVTLNDQLYGPQYSIANQRGKLSGVISISENPDDDKKADLFSNYINYTEHDSRGYRIMSQRTRVQLNDDTVSPLSFLNNSRVRNRMIHEVEMIGREYLFEFNDAITIGNLQNAIDNYVNQWVQNRTFSEAKAYVEPDEISREIVNVKLALKFTGTIETIYVDIVFE